MRRIVATIKPERRRMSTDGYGGEGEIPIHAIEGGTRTGQRAKPPSEI